MPSQREQSKLRVELLKILQERFNADGLHKIALHLEIDYDNLRGEGKVAKAVSLIEHLARREQLLELVRVGKELRPDIQWPGSVLFVIAAMTKEEAKALKKGAGFSPQELELFREFERELADIGITNWVEQYGKRRDDWRPLGQESSIWQEVLNVAAAVKPTVKPISYSDRVFAKDGKVRRATWNKLAAFGGIVIIDAISLFHTNIREKLDASGLTHEKKVPVFTLSPFDAFALSINGRIKKHIEQQFSRMFDYLFDHTLPEKEDPECEIGISGLRSLRRWLHRTIPHVIPVVKADEENIKAMEGKLGEGLGTGGIIFGDSGEL